MFSVLLVAFGFTLVVCVSDLVIDVGLGLIQFAVGTVGLCFILYFLCLFSLDCVCWDLLMLCLLFGFDGCLVSDLFGWVWGCLLWVWLFIVTWIVTGLLYRCYCAV